MTKLNKIYEIMNNVDGKTPIMLIGEAASLFKKLYRGNVYRVENTEEAKEFISRFTDVELEKPIVLEDITLLYRDTILLKLVEDIKTPLILLASEDNISATLRSRVKTFVKLPNREVKANFNKISESYTYIVENEITGIELDKYVSENCPDLAVLDYKMRYRRHKDKLTQILGGVLDAKHNKPQC